MNNIGKGSLFNTMLQKEEIMQVAHQTEAANSSEHHWWRDPDGFQKLCITFKSFVVLANMFLQYNVLTAKSSFCQEEKTCL